MLSLHITVQLCNTVLTHVAIASRSVELAHNFGLLHMYAL